MKLIWYPKCSTCRRAFDYLKNNNISFEVQDITLNTPSEEDLKKYILLSGENISNLFNASGIKYRELVLKNILPNISDEEKIAILASDRMLIKRPLLVMDEKVFVGF